MFFPLVIFERGNSLSFIYGIYGRENLFSQDHIGHKGIAEGSKSTSGLWSQVFIKALPNSYILANTIFAFLMLNTPRSAHKEIIGAKVSSFERAAIAYWCTDGYTAKKVSVQWMMELNKHNRGTIEPLYHSNTASFVIQKSLSCLPTQPLLESKRGFSCILWGQQQCQTPQKRPNKSLKPIFIL